MTVKEARKFLRECGIKMLASRNGYFHLTAIDKRAAAGSFHTTKLDEALRVGRKMSMTYSLWRNQ